MPDAILGLSAFYHDSAAAILVDGQIIAAAQEERFTRKKHDPDFPANALAYVMAESGLKLSDLSAVAFYDKPYLKFERLLETYHGFAPRGLTQLPDGHAGVDQGKAADALAAQGGTGQGGRRPAEDVVPGAPPVPRGQRLLSLALSRGGHPHPGRGGGMGHLPPSASARARTSPSCGSCNSPIRWGCSIRPSLTTAASRSIPANTSSWAWRPTAIPTPTGPGAGGT